MTVLPSLEEVLQDKLIEVADYQRPYAWGEKQLQDLWQDLDLLGSDRHYAGTLVLQRTDTIRRSQDGKDLVVYEVVDGQQRLTTCLILLEELRSAMGRITVNESVDVDINTASADLARLVRVNVDGHSVPRIQLGAELKEFFDHSVVGSEPPSKERLVAGEKRLLAAARYFKGCLERLVADVEVAEAARRLVELRARICFRLRFLVYDVESSAEVGVLFETLNDRGTDLSDLEKVKNYLLYLSRQVPAGTSEYLTSVINGAWSDIFKNLASLSLDDDALLRAHWIVTEDAIQRNWRRTSSVKAKFPRAKYVPTSGRLESPRGDAEQVDASTSLVSEIEEYVGSLRKCSAFLRDIYHDQAEYLAFGNPKLVEKIRLKSAALVRTGSVANFRALLLAARLRYPKDGDLYLRLLDLCERFSARAYVICVARSNAGQATLHWAAHRLFHDHDDVEEVIAKITSKLWQLAPDSAVRANFGASVEWYYRRSHKFVLYEYELALARTHAGSIPTFGDLTNGGSKTTEHVLPQNPGADSQWWVDFSPSEHSSMLNTIGNLVLTRDNSSYSNKDYALKRGVLGQVGAPCYFTSALQSEREIAEQFEHWNVDSIESRRAHIEEWALARWHVAAPASPVATPDDDGPEPSEEGMQEHSSSDTD